MKKILFLLLLALSLVGCNALVQELISAPEVKAVRLVDFSMVDKQVIFEVDLYNPNAFALPISGFSGDITLNNTIIGRINASSDQQLIAYSIQTVRLPISLDSNALIDATRSVLNKQQALYALNGNIATSIGKIPISKSGEISAQNILSEVLRY